jgi:hypothetical protein
MCDVRLPFCGYDGSRAREPCIQRRKRTYITIPKEIILKTAAEARQKTRKLDGRKPMAKKTQSVIARLSMVFVAAFVVCNLAIGQDVRTNYMPGTDFSKFHTYKWVAIEGGQHPNQIVDAQIKEAVDAQMAKKGLTKTPGDTADLVVGYQVAVDQEKQWNGYGTGRGWGGGMATATSSTINVGTLVLDMYDPSTKKLVWTGRATKTIEPSKSQEKNQEHLNKTMEKLLKDFPQKQK